LMGLCGTVAHLNSTTCITKNTGMLSSIIFPG
jgi:hypothetical protein